LRGLKKEGQVYIQKIKLVIINKVKIMSKNIEAKDDKPSWALSFGFYPGILFGMRTYEEETQTAYVFYLPFVDVAYEVFK
jgi:hypothetical protein